MSAICGIYFRDEDCDMDECSAQMKELGKYRFDKSGELFRCPIFLGCHLNYVVPESISEVLPYEEGNLVITADAIVDNREELFGLLHAPAEKQNCPDSILILETYKKWGTACVEKLVGDFSFAIWDKVKKELFCARDPVGRKSLYYYESDKIFAFSTLMNPLFTIKCIPRKLNDVYVADFLSLPSVSHEIDPHITIYDGIFQIPPACAMLIGENGSKMWRYWEIKKTNEIKFNSDKEYEEAFRDIYSEAVRCRLRCIKKVGISLSGGLDSGSVACLAAAELKKKGKKLYSFTQVPMAEYENRLPINLLADEREYVYEISNFTGNIEPRFLACEGKNPFTEIGSLLFYLEQPYKMFENSYWLCEILKTASTMDVGVLLSGQSGNVTVSWGSFISYCLYLLKGKHFVRYFREIKDYCALKNGHTSGFMFHNLLHILPYSFQKLKHRLLGGEQYDHLLSPVNGKFYKAMDEGKRLESYHADPLLLTVSDSFHQRMKLLNPAILSHIGALETKLSLAFGVEERDPTRDKRVIEFCINLPEALWVRDGVERSFIRSSMNGIMPDRVRLNTTVRGRQAADWVQRISPVWGEVRRDIEKIGEIPEERKYLDIPRIQEFLSKNSELDYADDGLHGLRLLIRSLIFSRFLRNLEN